MLISDLQEEEEQLQRFDALLDVETPETLTQSLALDRSEQPAQPDILQRLKQGPPWEPPFHSPVA